MSKDDRKIIKSVGIKLGNLKLGRCCACGEETTQSQSDWGFAEGYLGATKISVEVHIRCFNAAYAAQSKAA